MKGLTAYIVILILLSTNSLQAGTVIPSASITATASSTFFPSLTDASLTIDSSGMVGDLHGNDPQGRGMWLSQANGGGSATDNPAGQPGPAWIRYAFSSGVTLTEMWVWNHNQSGLTDRGLRNVSIHVREAGGGWSKVGDFTLARAPGTPDYPHGNTITLPGTRVDRVLITAATADGNHGSQYFGLSEVRFFGTSTIQGCWPSGFPFALVSVEKDPAYTQMLAPRTNGWLGSDVAKSIPLPNNRTVWLFGDTFIGRVENGARVPGARFINNSVGLEDRLVPPPSNIIYYWGTNQTSFFPHQAGTPGSLYWPTSGLYYRGELFIFCYSVSSGLNLANTTMIRVTNPLTPPPSWTWTAMDFGLGGNNLGFHTSIYVEEPYIYFMGHERKGGSDRAVLARMLGDHLVNGGLAESLEYWGLVDGQPQWTTSRDNLVPLFSPGVTESDIQYLPHLDLFVTTTYNPFQPRISVVAARKLTGPWSELACLYDVPEYNEVSFGIISYAARFHPQLSTSPNVLYMSYATNAFGDIDPLFTPEGLRIYAPQMLRIEIKPNSGDVWSLR